ncbi:hypothetical protein GCM10007856_50970 [Azospirillum oryzae]|nr:hypothetical protein GCM10007856_50970 [Azospirillum oryzae]
MGDVKSWAAQALRKQHSPDRKKEEDPTAPDTCGYIKRHVRAFMIRCAAAVKLILKLPDRRGGPCVGLTTWPRIRDFRHGGRRVPFRLPMFGKFATSTRINLPDGWVSPDRRLQLSAPTRPRADVVSPVVTRHSGDAWLRLRESRLGIHFNDGHHKRSY